MKISIIGSFALACILSSCEQQVQPTLDTSNYPQNISLIISKNCTDRNCHDTRSAANDSLDLTSWNRMTLGSGAVNDVIPYAPLVSHLFEHVNTDMSMPMAEPMMPLGRDPLSDADQKALYDWILHGAPDAAGRIPYADVEKKLFVVHAQAHVSSFDRSTERMIRYAQTGDTVGELQQAIAIAPDGQSYFTINQLNSGTVRKFSTKDNAPLGEFETGGGPTDLALLPDGSKGYATHDASGARSLFVFDPRSMKLLKTIVCDSMLQPSGVVVSKQGDLALVACGASDNVIVIDTRTDAVVRSIPIDPTVPSPLPENYGVRYRPYLEALSDDGSTLYVSLTRSGEVAAIDLKTNQVIKRVGVGLAPHRPALSLDGSELWVPNYLSNTVSVISTATNTVTQTIRNIESSPRSIAFNPDNGDAFVCCETFAASMHDHTGGKPGAIYVLDKSTKQIKSTIETPPLPADLRFN